ncbi:Citrate transporter [anaerobic digester metagenome]
MSAFGMFDFSMVGLPLSGVGIVFIALVGWRLVPARKQAGTAGFETSTYITELRVPAGSAVEGKQVREVTGVLADLDAQLLDLVRNDVYVRSPRPGKILRAGDILVLEANAGVLTEVLSRLDLKLEEDKPQAGSDSPGDLRDEGAGAPRGGTDGGLKDAGGDGSDATENTDNPRPDDGSEDRGGKSKEFAHDTEAGLAEMAVLPEARIVGSSASDLLLRSRYGINLLAVARQGAFTVARLRSLKFKPGDVLLLQGRLDVLNEFANSFGCVPLAQRDLSIPDKRKAFLAAGILAVSVVVTALGLLSAAVSFAAGVLASMALRTVPVRTVYEAVDWPVVVLLGALLPVADAMQSTGTADLLARLLLDNLAQGNAFAGLVVVMVSTMVLTDFMNNTATAAVMAPIGLGAALRLGVNPDTFLMAVAIGASCAFLTPIGHQNNTLILGPGGFRFGDYWRMGLPMDILVLATSIPLLLFFWPL